MGQGTRDVRCVVIANHVAQSIGLWSNSEADRACEPCLPENRHDCGGVECKKAGQLAKAEVGAGGTSGRGSLGKARIDAAIAAVLGDQTCVGSRFRLIG